MSRRLGPFRVVLCAAPAYLAKDGEPQTPKDLESHRCIRFRLSTSGKLKEWSPSEDNTDLELHLQTALTCNNMDALQLVTIGRFGIGYMPDFLAQDAIKNGALQTLLDSYLTRPGKFSTLWPSSRHLSSKSRAFVDFLSERLFKVEVGA